MAGELRNGFAGGKMSWEYRKKSRRGNWWDNAPQENLIVSKQDVCVGMECSLQNRRFFHITKFWF